MSSTLLLDRSSWDFALDVGGNMAVARAPYATVQDVASACRLFYDELYYGPVTGVRYFERVLGRFAPNTFLKAQLVEAALSVPGVLTAKVYLADVTARGLTGQVQITTADGPFVVSL